MPTVTAVPSTSIDPQNRDADVPRTASRRSDAERPLVTVTFVAWMRRELLIKGIESVLALTYRPVKTPSSTIRRPTKSSSGCRRPIRRSSA